MYHGLILILIIVLWQLWARKDLYNIANYIKDAFVIRNNTLEIELFLKCLNNVIVKQ